MSEHNTGTSPTPSQPTSGTARYWCHQCGSENPIYMAPDPTCQRCNSQFIEEIDDGGDDPRTFLTGVALDADDNGNDDDELVWGDDMFQSLRRSLGGGNNRGIGGGTPRIRVSLDTLSQTDGGDNGDGEAPVDAMLENILSNLLTSGIGNDQDDEDDDDDDGDDRRQRQSQRRTPMVFYRNMVDGNMQLTPLVIANGQQRTTTQGDGLNPLVPIINGGGDTQDDNGNGRQVTGNNLQGILQLISALTGTPMVGNPNDYVSSQAALDNIITQLMEQAGSGSAPPPAPEDVISVLPKRPVSEQEFIEDQVDCAVCKDEFNVSEVVIELPCQHLFHDDCIKPWLKVNGTCPVCRHSVVPSTSTSDNNNETSSSSTDQLDSNRWPTDRSDSSTDDGYELDSLREQFTCRSSATPQRPHQHQPTLPETQHRTTTGPTVAPGFAWLPRPSSPLPTRMFALGPGGYSNNYRPSLTRSTQHDNNNNNNNNNSTDLADVDIDLD